MKRFLRNIPHILLLLIALPLAGQDKVQTVRGSVIDIESHAPLEAAKVYLVETDPVIGTLTDAEGKFRLEEVPVGRYTLVVKTLGYEPREISGLQVGSGKEVVVNVEMTEAVVELDEVEIVAETGDNEAVNEMATVSARSFTAEQAGRFAAGINDPARLALSFAGVASQSDISNQVIVRGNSPAGLLWRLEGIEIPSPNHFSGLGASSGAVSMLSTNVLARSDFYTGAFPADYGNAASGVFDLHLRKGNNEKREFAVELGNQGLIASLEGPFAQKGGASYLLNYRYSTLNLMRELGYPLIGDAITGFQDLNLRFHFPSKKLGNFSVFGIGGKSEVVLPEVSDPALWQKKSDRDRAVSGYDMGAAGLSHALPIGQRAWLKTTVAFTGAFNYFRKSRLRKSDLTWEKRKAYRFTDYALRGASVLNYKFNAKNSLRTGVYYNRIFFDYKDQYQRSTGTFRFEGEGVATLMQAFAAWKHRFNGRLSLVTGAHFTLLALNRRTAVEPRLALEWQAAANHRLSFGAGQHSRVLALPTYVYERDSMQPNFGLPFARAVHLVAGYRTGLPAGFVFKTEIYFQYLHDIGAGLSNNPQYSLLNELDAYARQDLDPRGEGMNRGVEFTLEKSLRNGWYLLSTVSLYESKYRNNGLSWKDSRFNGNFITNLSGGKEFQVGRQKANSIGLNGRVLWSGGRRLIPIDLERSILAGEEILDFQAGFSSRVANYFRSDLQFTYRMNFTKAALQISLDVQNLTNHKNEYLRQYDEDAESVEVKYQLGIIPFLRVRVEF